MSAPLPQVRLLLVAFALFSFLCGPVFAAEGETEVVMLSGSSREDAVEWDFKLSSGRGSGTWTRIAVPSCWEQEGFGTYEYGGDHRPGAGTARPLAQERGTYRRSFEAPAEWKGRKVRLVFDGVMTDARVLLNGVEAGPVHQGGFYRFSHDIDGLLRPGAVNVLEVQVDRSSAQPGVNRAERIGDYWNFSGIFRPVWLEILPRTHIDGLAVDARADGSLRVRADIAGAQGGGLSLGIQCLDTQGRPVSAPLVRELVSARMELQTRVTPVRPWSAESPVLYTLVVTLEREGRVLHSQRARIGFRTFEFRSGDGFYLNGSRILLRGANRHCFHPDTARTLGAAQSREDVLLMKGMNMNAVRCSHYPPDVHFLDACDELGLYVIDELAGWQGGYDTAEARRLVGQMIRRDVNHASILFWANGNEGGWNTEVDDDYLNWDPQGRPVLHPWELFRGINTAHYRTHAQHLALCAGPDVYMPTEFLHALYDGGAAAGLADYWDALLRSPRAGGGFIWALVDEGVARSDQGGRIDNHGNTAADGILGPRREPEPSAAALRQLWSPVQLEAPLRLGPDFDGVLRLRNLHDFTPLDLCSFEWVLRQLPDKPGGVEAVLGGSREEGPPIAPRASGALAVRLPPNWRAADLFELIVRGADGREINRWTLPCPGEREPLVSAPRQTVGGVELDARPGSVVLRTARVEASISQATGQLLDLRVDGRLLPLRNGPRAVASLLRERSFPDLLPAPVLTSVSSGLDSSGAHVEALYSGLVQRVRWSLDAEGVLGLEVDTRHEGAADLLGFRFDLPEGLLLSKTWRGAGPHPIWRNRVAGNLTGVWTTPYNAPVPGQRYSKTPGFKGFFGDWSWLCLEGAGFSIVVHRQLGAPYFALHRIEDGTQGLYELPDLGLAFLEAIPAMRNKFHGPELLGPSSATPRHSGPKTHRLRFEFTTQPAAAAAGLAQ